MKLLLTSLGLTNNSIKQALESLTQKPLSDCNLVIVPTAMHAVPEAAGYLWQTLQGQQEFNWKSVDILELTSLPSLTKDHWLPAVQAADVMLVLGGNTPYLSFWFEQSGLSKLMPELLQKLVYVGISAGSMVASKEFNVDRQDLQAGLFNDDIYHDVAPKGAGSNHTLGLTDFTVLPHLNSEFYPELTLEKLQKAAQHFSQPVYILDDQSAVMVDGPAVTVVSEGDWQLQPGQADAPQKS